MKQTKWNWILLGLCMILFSILLLLEIVMLAVVDIEVVKTKIAIGTFIISAIGFLIVWWNIGDNA